MSAFLYSADVRDAWSGLQFLWGFFYGTWYWDAVPVYYQNWGPINPNPSDRGREWYGVLTTEGGGHWMYFAKDKWDDIQHRIYQRQEGE